MHTDLPQGAKCGTVVQVSTGLAALLASEVEIIVHDPHLEGSMLSCHRSCHASFCLKNCSSLD